MLNKQEELTFWEHLSELLHRLRRIFISVIISTIFVMIFPLNINWVNFSLTNPWFFTVTSLVIKKIQADFLPPEVELLPISWFAPLEVYFYVSILLGVLISLPVIVYELSRFISPALHKQERKVILTFVASFTGLFIFGFMLGYTFIIPVTVKTLFLFSTSLGLPPKYEFSEFFSLVTGGLFICGLMFTFPVFLVLLVKLGVIKTEYISKNRKYIYGGILVLISILDPDPTILCEILLIIPIILLTEASILIARRFEHP